MSTATGTVSTLKKNGGFSAWYSKQIDLLTIEQDEGNKKHEQKKLQISKLQLSDVKVGAFGKTYLTLHRDKPITSGIQVGSPVKLLCPKWAFGEQGEIEHRGIVKSIEEHSIEIICKGVGHVD